MERLQIFFDQLSSHLSIAVAILWLTELFTLCLVLFAAVNARRLSKKVNATLRAVEKLRRSADNQRLREIGASMQRKEESDHRSLVKEQTRTSPRDE
jgi:hypothetical protein